MSYLDSARPGASVSGVARQYWITARLLFRWKQELAPAAIAKTTFLPVAVKAQRHRALRLPQRRSPVHGRRPSHEPSRRSPAVEQDANIRQPLTDVQQPDAYDQVRGLHPFRETRN